MSDGKDEQNDSIAQDAEIVDAEVVVETAVPQDETVMKTVKAAPADSVKSGKAGKSSKAGWITAGLLAAFIGGVYASPYFEAGLIALGLRNSPPPAVPAGEAVDLSPLQNEVSDLKAALVRHQEILAQQQVEATKTAGVQDQLRKDFDLLAGVQNPASAIMNSADVANIKADVTRLSDDLARLSALNAAADPAVSQLSGALALARAESAQLKERLSAIESTMQAVEAGALEASPRGRLVLLLSRMKDRALVGLPFAADLKSLRADIAELPALDQQLMGAELAVLEGAGDSIHSYAALVRDFDPSVAAALRAGEKEEGSFLSNLFTARRTDAGAVGDDAVFVKAERLLLARDVAGTVETLGVLEGAVAETLQPWRSAAEAHVRVMRAFDRLTAAAAQAGSSASTGEPQ